MYKKTLDEKFLELTSGGEGLSNKEVLERQKKYGKNKLEEASKENIILIFFSSFKDIMVAILIAAAIVSAVLGNITDALIIMFIVIVNSIISTVQYIKAQNSLNALKKMSPAYCIVKRNGEEYQVKTEELVPGDIVILKAGDIVPADGRLIESMNLEIDESALTGESINAVKDASFETTTNIPLGDRVNMLYSSTIVRKGRGEFIVTTTGMDTEIGKIAFLISAQEDKLTPLQEKLNRVGKILAAIVVLVAIIIFVVGIIQDKSIEEMFFVAVSMAVAAIPEGLSAIVTIILSIGVVKLSKRNAVIRRLPSVETLGSATVICSDKTGTLTQNKMAVSEIFTSGDSKKLALQALMLCNDSFISISSKVEGDPMEVAFVNYGMDEGFDYNELQEKFKRVQEISFDSTRKMMTTVNEFENKLFQYTKGGIDEVLNKTTHYINDNKIQPITDEIRKNYLDKNTEFTSKGMRVLAVAYKKIDSIEEVSEEGLIFLGIVSIVDPPRESVKESIRICKQAGIKTVMITGDHLLTAKAIADELEILEEGNEYITGVELDKLSNEEFKDRFENIRVYARVTPENKVRIVSAWRDAGHVVAMTGDGVNDAAALKNSDIGIAMGVTGTDVTRESADLILMDDNFSTIVGAVEEGRTIYANIEKTIRYLLSCNLGELILLFAALVFLFELPLIPVQILWINLVSDSFPALALGVEPREEEVMHRRPKSQKEGLLSKKTLLLTIFDGLIVGLVGFISFYVGRGFSYEIGITMSFMTIGFSQLFHAFNMRFKSSMFNKNFFANKKFFLAVIISALLLIITIFVPYGREVFKTTLLSLDQWTAVMGLSIVPILITEIRKVFVHN